MINRKYWGFFSGVIPVLLNITSFSLAGQYSIQQESLRDLKGVYISVESLAPEIQKDGLTEDRIRKDVELMLREAGIKILSKKEWFDAEGSPYLYVNAYILKLRDTREYIYSVNISFKQTVYPARKPVEITGAATWTIGGIIGITPDLDKIRASVKTQVEEFIKAYLSVNPK
jgi:biotin operon repressor